MSDLVACAQRVIEEANALWVELGLDGAARVAKLNTFIAGIEGALETLLAQERAERDRVKQGLVEKTRRIVATSEALGIETPQLDICTCPLLQSDAVVTECLAGLEERRAKVAACLDALLAQLGVLKAQLGDVPAAPELESRTDLRRTHLDQLRATIESLERTRQKRVAQVRENAARVAALCADMREAVPECVADVCAAATADAVCVSAENVQHISEMLGTCENMHARRVDLLDALKHSIRVHYAKLGLPEAELDAFLASVQTTDLRTIEACRAELSRLFELKRRNAARLVDVALARVRELWDILAVPAARRVLPPPCAEFFADADPGEPLAPALVHGALAQDGAAQPTRPLLDDDLLAAALAALEAEARRLEACRRELAPIVQRIEERKRLVREREEFELSAADPKRFGRRGYSAVSEDQQRRRFYVTLPRLEAALIARLREWRAAHGALLYDGVDYLALLEREHAAAAPPQKQAPATTRHRRVRSANDVPSADGGAPFAVRPGAPPASAKASSRRKRALLKKKKLGVQAPAPGQTQAPAQVQAQTQTQTQTPDKHAPALRKSPARTAGATCGKKRHPPGKGGEDGPRAGPVVSPRRRAGGGDGAARLGETQRKRVRRSREGAQRSGGRLASLARRVAAQHRLNRRLCSTSLPPIVPLPARVCVCVCVSLLFRCVCVLKCCTGLSKRTLNKAFF